MKEKCGRNEAMFSHPFQMKSVMYKEIKPDFVGFSALITTAFAGRGNYARGEQGDRADRGIAGDTVRGGGMHEVWGMLLP